MVSNLKERLIGRQENLTTETRNGSDSRRALLNVPIGDIYASGTNPRKRFDDAALGELAESVRLQGVLEPLLVRVRATKDGKPRGLGEKELYEIIAGERRWRAAKLAKRAEVPCVVCEATDDQAADMQLAENIQRAELSPLEEAHALAAALERQKKANHFATAGVGDGLSAKEVKSRDEKLDSAAESVGRKIGKSAKYVYDRIKLLELAEKPRKALEKGEIQAGHAIELARIEPERQERILEELDDYGDSTPSVQDVRNAIRYDNERIEREKAEKERRALPKKKPNAAAMAKEAKRKKQEAADQERYAKLERLREATDELVVGEIWRHGAKAYRGDGRAAWAALLEFATRHAYGGVESIAYELLSGKKAPEPGTGFDLDAALEKLPDAQLKSVVLAFVIADLGDPDEKEVLAAMGMSRKELEKKAAKSIADAAELAVQTAAKTAGNEAPAVGKSAGKRKAKAGRKAGKRAPAERVSRAKKAKK